MFGTLVFWVFFFFFNDTATTEIYTLSLHDALPIRLADTVEGSGQLIGPPCWSGALDRKSTRLNSSHVETSYAVFCLKKNKITHDSTHVVIIIGKRTSYFLFECSF